MTPPPRREHHTFAHDSSCPRPFTEPHPSLLFAAKPTRPAEGACVRAGLPSPVHPPTHEQFRRLRDETITPMQRTLRRLRLRLEQRGYLLDDPYYAAVARAEEAVYALSIATHYASCESGVGNPTEPPAP